MGLYPNIWGFHQWAMLHLMAYTYPDNPTSARQESMLKYVTGMCNNLPCPGCSWHCKEYIKKHKPRVTSKEELTKYFVDFHNEVNVRLGKRRYSYEEADNALKTQFLQIKEWQIVKRAADIRVEDQKEIDMWKSKCEKSCNNNTGAVLASIILGIVLFVIAVLGLIWLVKK